MYIVKDEMEPAGELGTFRSLEEAEMFCGSLPDADTGRYGIDGPLDYSQILERVADKYKPLAMALLNKIRAILEDEDLTVHDPWTLDGDTYQWVMVVHRHEGDHADDDGVDITVEISEERDYDDAEGYGINFGIDIVEYGGRILGGLAPYNFTPDVWVDSRDDNAVADRWKLIEDADYSGLPDMITEGWEWDTDGYYKRET
jgi:hypothetical protein